MLSKLWAVCKSLSRLFFLKDAYLQAPEADVYQESFIHKDLFNLHTDAPRSMKKIPQLQPALQVWDTRKALQPSGQGCVFSLIKLLNAFEDTPKRHWCSLFAGQQPLCTPHQTQSLGSSLLGAGRCSSCFPLDSSGKGTQHALHSPRSPGSLQEVRLTISVPWAPAANAALQEPPNSNRQHLTITCTRPQLPLFLLSHCYHLPLPLLTHFYFLAYLVSLSASEEWTWMVTNVWVFSSSWLTYVIPSGKVHYFLLWKMLLFQTIKPLYILANLENMHILKWPHISNANHNCLILNIFPFFQLK